MSTHNPNPFDFVPFSDEGPILKTVEDWQKIDDKKVSGVLELQIEALTPVHIVGEQRSHNGKTIDKSFFNRRNDKYVIPSTSIKGMLRSFIEATCNCWAGEITPQYLQEDIIRNGRFFRRKRHHAFAAVDMSEIDKSNINSQVEFKIDNAVPKHLRKKVQSDGKIDLASFLFGFTTEDETTKDYASRLIISDAIINNEYINDQYELPDIPGNAFMGSPNPNLRKWWYFEPDKFVWRWSKNFRGNPIKVYDFLGKQFRGRKFYYHQHWDVCVETYFKEQEKRRDKYTGELKDTLYSYNVESIIPGKRTESFFLEFKEIPLKLFYLVLWALQPAPKLKHKLGYGKPLGFGSIDIHLENLTFRVPQYVGAFIPKISLETIKNWGVWSKSKLDEKIGAKYFCDKSLDKLAQILTFESDQNIVFKYPPAARDKGFWRQIDEVELTAAMAKVGLVFPPEKKEIDVSSSAKTLAEELIDVNPTLHFQVYQEAANHYKDTIQKRTYESTLT